MNKIINNKWFSYSVLFIITILIVLLIFQLSKSNNLKSSSDKKSDIIQSRANYSKYENFQNGFYIEYPNEVLNNSTCKKNSKNSYSSLNIPSKMNIFEDLSSNSVFVSFNQFSLLTTDQKSRNIYSACQEVKTNINILQNGIQTGNIFVKPILYKLSYADINSEDDLISFTRSTFGYKCVSYKKHSNNGIDDITLPKGCENNKYIFKYSERSKKAILLTTNNTSDLSNSAGMYFYVSANFL